MYNKTFFLVCACNYWENICLNNFIIRYKIPLLLLLSLSLSSSSEIQNKKIEIYSLVLFFLSKISTNKVPFRHLICLGDKFVIYDSLYNYKKSDFFYYEFIYTTLTWVSSIGCNLRWRNNFACVLRTRSSMRGIRNMYTERAGFFLFCIVRSRMCIWNAREQVTQGWWA